jgi:hypothetical protein
MSSPKARRRQRSTRVVTAVALVVIAAVVVLGAVLSGSFPLVSVAAVLAVVLGGVAARITYSELTATRRQAAADRARQAQAYRTMAEERSAEHRDFAGAMQTRVGRAERAVTELEGAVVAAQGRAADAMRKLGVEARRADLAEAEGGRVVLALDESEERAAEAIVRVAELEQDNDVLRAENTGLRAELDAGHWPHARQA